MDAAARSDLAANASQAAMLMRLLGNEKRLLVLCHLLAAGEVSVGALATAVGLTLPALSQHLALLRAQGLVDTRRQTRLVLYRVADRKAAALLGTLRELYCPDPG